MRITSFSKVWQDFWFTPESPITISVFRIAFGIVFLSGILTQYWLDFKVFFGAHPWIPHEDYVAFWTKRNVTINLFEIIPTQDAWHIAFFVVIFIFGVMMTIGLFTRFSIIAVFVMYSSISHQYPFLLNAGDNMQRLVLFLLCFSRAGDCLSVDTYLKNRDGDWKRALVDVPPRPAWLQRMIQVQLAICYFNTALLKINSPVWFHGNGLYIATRLNDFFKLPVPFIFEHKLSLEIMDWLAVFTEFSMGTLVWIKEFRYWVLLGGVLLHMGIDWSMNIPVFEYVFMSVYILFIDAEDIKKLGRWFLSVGNLLYYKKTSLKKASLNSG